MKAMPTTPAPGISGWSFERRNNVGHLLFDWTDQIACAGRVIRPPDPAGRRGAGVEHT